MATTETPLQPAPTADAAQQQLASPPDPHVETSAEVTDLLTILNSGPAAPALPPAEVEGDKARTDGKDVSGPKPALTAPVELTKPSDSDPAHPSAEKPPASQGDEKAGFLSSLRKGLSIALVPKPHLDNATDKKDKKGAGAADPSDKILPAVDGDTTATPLAPSNATATNPTPPVRKTSFAAFKSRVTLGFSSPVSGTPTKKSTPTSPPPLTDSPPASPRKSTSMRVQEIAETAVHKVEETAAVIKRGIDHATGKAKEDSSKPEEGAIKTSEGSQKKVDQIKEKAEALGKKFEGTFFRKSSLKVPVNGEADQTKPPEETSTAPTSTEVTPEKPPKIDTTQHAKTASSPASPTRIDHGTPTSLKVDQKLRSLKKRFSLSVYSSKNADKDGAADVKGDQSSSAVKNGDGTHENTSGNKGAVLSTTTTTSTANATEVSPGAPLQRKPSIFSAFVQGKNYFENHLSDDKYEKTSRIATSPPVSYKSNPMESAMSPDVFSASPPPFPGKEADANVASIHHPTSADEKKTKNRKDSSENSPSSPGADKTSKGTSPPSTFNLEKLNKFASKVIDKGKEEIKAGRNRLSVDLSRMMVKKDGHDKESSAVSKEEDNKAEATSEEPIVKDFANVANPSTTAAGPAAGGTEAVQAEKGSVPAEDAKDAPPDSTTIAAIPTASETKAT